MANLANLLCLLTIVVVFQSALALRRQLHGGCSNRRNQFPTAYNVTVSPSGYPFLSSALEIFSSTEIPYNGYLTSWNFLNKNGYIFGVYFGVFRRLKGSRTSFVIVNSTKLAAVHFHVLRQPHGFSGAVPPEKENRTEVIVNENIIQRVVLKLKKNTWYRLEVPEPFPVQKGDLLGIFYESYFMKSGLLTVPTRTVAKAPRSKTYILFEDYESLTLHRGGHEFQSTLSGHYLPIDTKFAGIDYREPGLYALVNRRKTMDHRRGQPVLSPIPECYANYVPAEI